MIELKRVLFLDGEEKPPRLKKEDDQAWTLIALANSYSMSGQSHRAVPLIEMANDIYENKTKDKENLARGLSSAADDQLKVGALSAAERNLYRQVEICEQNDLNKFQQPGIHYELGRVYCYSGKWRETEEQLNIAENIKKNHVQAQSVIWSYRTLHFLFMARETVISGQSSLNSVKSAIECAQRALELADETTKQRYAHPRDYVRAYWLLGSAYRANHELTLAEENLSKALNLCRQINSVDTEADILLDLARLRFAQGDFKDAQEKASEALVITERSGYVLQGADVNLFLAQYALEQEKDKAKAKEYAETALRLATCDGPPYYYKVAYEEAERFLAQLQG